MAHQKPINGEAIEITARKCGKLQPKVTLGSKWLVLRMTKTPSGIDTVECAPQAKRRRPVRINSDSFSWKVLSKRDVAESESVELYEKIGKEFTKEEKLRIAVIPLIYAHIAWSLANEAVDLSIQHRVTILKEVSRSVRVAHRSYQRLVSRDLRSAEEEGINNIADDFRGLHSYAFNTLHYTILNLLAKHYPEYPYPDLMGKAIEVINIIMLYDKANEEADNMIRERLGRCKSYKRMPLMDTLYGCMKAMAGETEKISMGERDLMLCRTIIDNRLRESEINIR